MKFGKLEGIFYKPFISLTIIAEIKRGRRAYTRKNENTTKATQPENEAQLLPASPISSPDGGSDVEKLTPEGSSKSQLLPPYVNTKLPSPFVLATEDNDKSPNLPSVLPEPNISLPKEQTSSSSTGVAKMITARSESEISPPDDSTKLIDQSADLNLPEPNNPDVINICNPDDTFISEDADVSFDMVVRLLNVTPAGRLSPTALVDPDLDYLVPDGAHDLPEILRASETPDVMLGKPTDN